MSIGAENKVILIVLGVIAAVGVGAVACDALPTPPDKFIEDKSPVQIEQMYNPTDKAVIYDMRNEDMRIYRDPEYGCEVIAFDGREGTFYREDQNKNRICYGGTKGSYKAEPNAPLQP